MGPDDEREYGLYMYTRQIGISLYFTRRLTEMRCYSAVALMVVSVTI